MLIKIHPSIKPGNSILWQGIGVRSSGAATSCLVQMFSFFQMFDAAADHLHGSVFHAKATDQVGLQLIGLGNLRAQTPSEKKRVDFR